MIPAPRSKMLSLSMASGSKAKAKAVPKAVAKAVAKAPKAKAKPRAESPLAAAARRAREAVAAPRRRPPGSHGPWSPTKQLTAQTSETSAGSTPKHLELEEKADRAEILEVRIGEHGLDFTSFKSICNKRCDKHIDPHVHTNMMHYKRDSVTFRPAELRVTLPRLPRCCVERRKTWGRPCGSGWPRRSMRRRPVGWLSWRQWLRQRSRLGS